MHLSLENEKKPKASSACLALGQATRSHQFYRDIQKPTSWYGATTIKCSSYPHPWQEIFAPWEKQRFAIGLRDIHKHFRLDSLTSRLYIGRVILPAQLQTAEPRAKARAFSKSLTCGRTGFPLRKTTIAAISSGYQLFTLISLQTILHANFTARRATPKQRKYRRNWALACGHHSQRRYSRRGKPFAGHLQRNALSCGSDLSHDRA